MSGILVEIRNPGYPEYVFEDMCNSVFDDIVNATPVDTGTCQAGWNIQFDDNTCVIWNDIEYTSFLEDGWSKQSPNGMVEISLQKYNLDYSIS
jgi:hypothetical protein